MTANPIAQYPQGGGGGLTPALPAQVLAVAAASVSFANIPQNFTNLKLVMSVSGSGSDGNVQIQFNGDTGDNYDTQFLTGTGSTASASAASALTVGLLGNLSGDAEFPNSTSLEITIPNYRSSTFWKAVFADNIEGGAIAQTRIASGVNWHSTAPITSIVISSSSGNFIAGSTFTLYGY